MSKHHQTAQVSQERDSHANVQRQRGSEEPSNAQTHDVHPLEKITSGIGDAADVAKHVSVIQRTGLFHPMNERQKVQSLLKLQQRYGNRFVQRVIDQHAIQTKLQVNQPGDVYEQEADRVAEQVMRIPEPPVQRQPKNEEESIQTKPLSAQITPLLQRQREEEKDEPPQTKLISPNYPTFQRQEELEEDEEKPLQTKEVPSTTPDVTQNIETCINAMRGGGQPLSESEHAFFEPRFGYDFSQVRVHTDTQAAETAQALNARAFTVKQDVVFGARQYAPETTLGRRLLAHELTHIVQQSGLQGRSSYRHDHIARKPKGDPPESTGTFKIRGDNVYMYSKTNKNFPLTCKIDNSPQKPCPIPRDSEITVVGEYRGGLWLLIQFQNEKLAREWKGKGGIVRVFIEKSTLDVDQKTQEKEKPPAEAAPTEEPPAEATPTEAEKKKEAKQLKAKLDRIEKTYQDMIKDARKKGYNVAADNLERFLKGTGSVKKISSKWLRGFSSVTDAERVNQKRFEKSLTKKAYKLKDGESDSFSDYWDRKLTASTFVELFYASGTSTIRSTGTFKLTRKGKVITIEGSVAHHWWDKYDWHAGLAAYVPGYGSISDSDALLLQKHRGAAPFDMESDWKQSVTGKVEIVDWWFDEVSYEWQGP